MPIASTLLALSRIAYGRAPPDVRLQLEFERGLGLSALVADQIHVRQSGTVSRCSPGLRANGYLELLNCLTRRRSRSVQWRLGRFIRYRHILHGFNFLADPRRSSKLLGSCLPMRPK